MSPPALDDFERRLAALETERDRALRSTRRVLGIACLAFIALGAVTVKDADLEILPQVIGGNPNDSHLLKLIADGDTGADRAMTLRTAATTDSDYRLAIADNGGNERVSIDDDGNVGIGDTTPNYLLDVAGDARIGWNGHSTRIKLIPSDFMGNDDFSTDPTAVAGYEDDDAAVGSGENGVRISRSSGELYAFVAIPNGYEATHVRIYGNDTDTVTVYESDIDQGAWSASLGSAATGTEIDITDVAADGTHFLVIQIAVNGTADTLYGGYVTIARQ